MYQPLHIQQLLISERRKELQRIADQTHLRRIAREHRRRKT
jgi:hypothetical protein